MAIGVSGPGGATVIGTRLSGPWRPSLANGGAASVVGEAPEAEEPISPKESRESRAMAARKRVERRELKVEG
jgi:hypothetical protein